MKLTKSMMKQILKEEYEKRIVHFLKEEVPRETSYGTDVWFDAENLKVREKKGGDEYIFHSIVKKNGEEFFKLFLSDEFRAAAYSKGAESPMVESDYDEAGEIGFISRVGDRGREISPVDNNFDQLKLLSSEDKDSKEQGIKLPPRKYILIPSKQFEKRFEIQ
jgi:hypothetical protein